jgi:hypothetical protein
MLIYNESHTGSAADLYATLQPHRPHQPRNQRPHERAEQILVPLGAPVRYRKVLGSVINEAPPCRVNDSMKLQVRHDHEFEAVHASISHKAQGLTDTVLCPPAIEALPSMSRRIRRGLR